MPRSLDPLFWFADPKFRKNIGRDYSYVSDFETPSSQKTWMNIYFFVAFACLFLALVFVFGLLKSSPMDLRIAFILYGVASAFGGVGLFSLIQAFRSFYKKSVIERSRRQYPSSPWKWRKDWAQGIIQNKKGSPTSWILALLYNFIFMPVAVMAVITSDFSRDIIAIIAGLGFSAAGISLLGYVILFALRRRKYGVTICQPSIMPVKLGADVRYTIRIPANLKGIDNINCRIFCRGPHKMMPDGDETTEPGYSSDTQEPESDEGEIESVETFENTKEILSSNVNIFGGQTSFTVSFTIDPKSGLTAISDDNLGRVWFLEIKGKCTGVDYKALFEVPVFSGSIDVTGVLIQDALKRGESMIHMGTAVVALGSLVIFLLIMILKHPMAEHQLAFFGLLIALITGWLWRSIMITRWKIWAYENVDDIDELKEKALRRKILYPKDHFLTKTEIRTIAQKQRLAELERKK